MDHGSTARAQAASTYVNTAFSPSATTSSVLFSKLNPPPPTSTPFPYTTLFRSLDEADDVTHPENAPGNALRMEGLELVERSEEHTSELQSPDHLVCRLLLEKTSTLAVLRLGGRPAHAAARDGGVRHLAVQCARL